MWSRPTWQGCSAWPRRNLRLIGELGGEVVDRPGAFLASEPLSWMQDLRRLLAIEVEGGERAVDLGVDATIRSWAYRFELVI